MIAAIRSAKKQGLGALLVVASTAGFSCGGGESADGDGVSAAGAGADASSGGSAAGASSGGGAAGVSTGGSAGVATAGADGSSSTCGTFEPGSASKDVTRYCGNHCSPGTYRELPYGSVMKNCYEYVFQQGVGVQNDIPSTSIGIRNIKLSEPMVAGQPYAFSSENRHPIQQTEFWGTDAECGVGLELLWSGPQPRETIDCWEFMPSAAYTNVLMVWKGGGQHYGVTLCPQGSCG